MLVGKLTKKELSGEEVDLVGIVGEIPEVEKGKRRQPLRHWLADNFKTVGAGTFVLIDMNTTETVKAEKQTKLVFSKEGRAEQINPTADLPPAAENKEEEPPEGELEEEEEEEKEPWDEEDDDQQGPAEEK